LVSLPSELETRTQNCFNKVSTHYSELKLVTQICGSLSWSVSFEGQNNFSCESFVSRLRTRTQNCFVELVGVEPTSKQGTI